MMGFWYGSGISWTKQSAPCCRQTTTLTPHHSVFYRPDSECECVFTPHSECGRVFTVGSECESVFTPRKAITVC